ncbi:ABC transporter permease [Streptomyces sp. NPDC052396]|uniref:ABC transporter permease n=1 Tax=Streptomyces sp. NPDC052396 TaxID=3365689 RepID=UPI0037CF422C
MSAATITAPVTDARLGLRDHLRHISALARRNALQLKQNPEAMVDVVLTPVIFTLMFVYVFGGAMFPGHRDDYVNYLVPGLMAMTGLNIAMAVGSGVNEDFQKGVMDRFRTLPIARSSVLIAKIVVEVGRMLVAVAIQLGMGFALGLEIKTSVGELLAAVALSVLFGASLMWIFVLLGLTAKSAQAVQGMGMMIMIPLQFASSIFAPTKSMPGWLRGFTEYNPLANLADAARSLINGGPVAHSVWMTLAWSVGLTVVVAPLAVAKFRRRA